MHFRHLNYTDGLPDLASIQDAVQDPLGRVWIAYDRGLFRYDGHEIRRLTHIPTDSTSVAEEFVRALYVDGDGRIWVGTANRGISIYDPATDSFSHIRSQDEGGPLPIRSIWSIWEDSNGILWIAANPGLIRHDIVNGSFEHYTFDHPDYSELERDFLNDGRKILEDPRDPNRIFYATRGGLLAFDKLQQEFTHLRMPFIGPHGFDYLINDLLFKDSSSLWMGTWSGYLLHLDTRTHEWKQFVDTSDESGQGIIRMIQRKSDHALWIAGTPGFGYFNMNKGTFTYFHHDPDDFKSIGDLDVPGSMLFTRDSTLMVFGRRGISISDPYPGYDPAKEQFQPYLDAILVNGHILHHDTSVAFLEGLALEEDENTLQFKVAWPVFQDHRNVWYRYRLEGWDSGWSVVEQGRLIQYTNLKGGDYHFQYQVSRNGREWINGRTSPSINIHLPFWKRPFVQSGGVLLVVGLLYMAHTARLRQIRGQQKVEKAYHRRVAELEMTALRAQMNPHFLFNALNSIRNFILKENTQLANTYLTKFARLMRTILRNSESKLVSLNDELTALRLYVEFESMRFKDKICVEWYIDPAIDTRSTYLPPLIIQPYVENAIWHGLVQKQEGGILNIRFEIVQDHLQITVRDNGVGRAQAAVLRSKQANGRKSYGMDITAHRVDLVKETLDIDSQVTVNDLSGVDDTPSGTEVIITLPVIKD